MKTRSPFVWASMAGLAVLVAAFVPVVWQMVVPPQSATQADALPAPWVIAAEGGTAGAVRALGLRLPGSTLRDAQAVWGDGMQVALVAHRGQPPALEAYVDRWTGGGVAGKLVLATDARASDLARWQAQSSKREVIDADAQRWRLNSEDRDLALASGIVGMSFLPASRIDADTLQARFGTPAERVAGEGSVQHWLFPKQGLAIAFDATTGRAVVQLVPLGEFETRLAAPVRAAAPR